jgi:hypothetical protein
LTLSYIIDYLALFVYFGKSFVSKNNREIKILSPSITKEYPFCPNGLIRMAEKAFPIIFAH